jgi:anti-anti-sigma factor
MAWNHKPTACATSCWTCGGLTFMDLTGLHELIRQNEFARSNRHNLAVVRGTDAIQRVLKLTGVEEMLVLVDDPDDLVPPPVTH